MPRPTRSPYDDNKPWLDSSRAEAMSAGFLHQATVTLDNDQVKHLPTVSIEIVPTPGTSKIVLVQSGFLLSAITVNYEGIHAGSVLRFAYSGDNHSASSNVGNDVTDGFSSVTDLLTQNGARAIIGPPLSPNFNQGALNAFTDASTQTNQAVNILCDNVSGDLTGGDAANTLLVSVAYYILNVITGEFE